MAEEILGRYHTLYEEVIRFTKAAQYPYMLELIQQRLPSLELAPAPFSSPVR